MVWQCPHHMIWVITGMSDCRMALHALIVPAALPVSYSSNTLMANSSTSWNIVQPNQKYTTAATGKIRYYAFKLLLNVYFTYEKWLLWSRARCDCFNQFPFFVIVSLLWVKWPLIVRQISREVLKLCWRLAGAEDRYDGPARHTVITHQTALC